MGGRREGERRQDGDVYSAPTLPQALAMHWVLKSLRQESGAPLYRWGSPDSQMWSNFPHVAQHVNGRVRIQTQAPRRGLQNRVLVSVSFSCRSWALHRISDSKAPVCSFYCDTVYPQPLRPILRGTHGRMGWPGQVHVTRLWAQTKGGHSRGTSRTSRGWGGSRAGGGMWRM